MARVEAARERNWRADADGEEITEQNGYENHDADEGQGLLVEFGDAGVGAGFINAALGDDGPVHFGESAVGTDHLHLAVIIFLHEMHGFGIAQILGERLDLRHHVGLVA